MNQVPYFRLSGFYLFYYATLGAMVPYWSLYLKDLGFTAQAIGVLMSTVMATRIVSPNIWGWIADHTGRRMMIVRIGCLLAVLCFLGVFVTDSFTGLLLVMLAFSFFWNAALPQVEVTTFNHLGQHAHRYSSVRLWGSIGFIATVASLGPLLDEYGAGILPAILLGLFGAIWLSSLTVPEGTAGHLPLDHEPLRAVLSRPVVVALLVACLLMQFSHGPYYTFYTIYMEDHGYRRAVIGQLWALGVLAEVGIFLAMHRLVPRLGLHRLLMASFALTVLRWLLIGAFPDFWPVMVGAQVLHAASFGIYHATAIQLIHRYFSGRHQGKGQALYSSLSFGAGGALGSLSAGYSWDHLGAGATFYLAAAASFIGLLIVWRFVRA